MEEVLLEKRSQGRKLGGGMRDVTPPNKEIPILPERRSQNNCGIAINRNFLLKYNKFAKILPEIDAQITGNDLCRAQDFQIFPKENPPDLPRKHDHVLASVPTITSVQSGTPPNFFLNLRP